MADTAFVGVLRSEIARQVDRLAHLERLLALYEGGEFTPIQLRPRSGETTGPTAKPTPPVANSSAMTACPHVVGEGQECLASASPSILPTAAAKLDAAVRRQRERMAKATPSKKRGLPENVYAKDNRFVAKVAGAGGRKIHIGSFKTADEAAGAVAAFKLEVERRAAQDAPLGIPLSVQSGGETGERPEEGLPALPGQDGATIVPGKGSQSVTTSGAGEGAATPADPASESDTVSSAEPTQELPVGAPDVKGEAPASSPSLGVPSQTGRSSSSEVERPVLEERRAKLFAYYAENDVSFQMLGDRFGVAKATAVRWIETGRVERDQRVMAGDVLRGRMKNAIRVPGPPEPKPEPQPLVTGASAPPSPVRMSSSVYPLDDLPRVASASSLESIGPIAFDKKSGIVAGPKGFWQTHVQCVEILSRLARLDGGQVLDTKTLSRGTMSTNRIDESLPLWRSKLAEIGVELGSMGPNLFLKKMEV